MGKLWRVGANQAVDVLVTRASVSIPGPRGLEMLAIQRRDGSWAIPGGFLDEGEPALVAGLREIEEETGLELWESELMELYHGKVEDPRNEKDRWIETTLFHVQVSSRRWHELGQTLRAGSDASNVRWIPIWPNDLPPLYADHPRLVRMAREFVVGRAPWEKISSEVGFIGWAYQSAPYAIHTLWRRKDFNPVVVIQAEYEEMIPQPVLDQAELIVRDFLDGVVVFLGLRGVE